MKKYQKGHASSKPYYVFDEKTGKLIQLNLPANAIMPESKPGYKAGNSLLDEINEQLEQEGLVKKIKELYRKRKK